MIVLKMLTAISPAVKYYLNNYRSGLQKTGGPLARQGLDSIRDKEFHCIGGGTYALLAPKNLQPAVLDFIVAFQTISDYLDNLCDRFGVQGEQIFRQLHKAMSDSLQPAGSGYSDYYSLFPENDDGGYLVKLVNQCRRALATLPYFPGRKKLAQRFLQLYIDLQSYKHLDHGVGEQSLEAMYGQVLPDLPGLYWWEYAAACGSTLGIFALVAGADPVSIWNAYMPWVNGLHILLDYFIDQNEDRQHGDMNLIAYYGSIGQAERILWFYRQARIAVKSLADSSFHTLVVDGLPALYLSDCKAHSPDLTRCTGHILKGSSWRTRTLARSAGLLRKGMGL